MITAHTELGSAQCEDGSAGTFRTPCAWTLWASKAGGMEGGTQRGNPVDPGASAGATPRWAFECARRGGGFAAPDGDKSLVNCPKGREKS